MADAVMYRKHTCTTMFFLLLTRILPVIIPSLLRTAGSTACSHEIKASEVIHNGRGQRLIIESMKRGKLTHKNRATIYSELGGYYLLARAE